MKASDITLSCYEDVYLIFSEENEREGETDITRGDRTRERERDGGAQVTAAEDVCSSPSQRSFTHV